MEQIGTDKQVIFSTVSETKLSKTNEVSLHQIKNLARSLEQKESHRLKLKACVLTSLLSIQCVSLPVYQPVKILRNHLTRFE